MHNEDIRGFSNQRSLGKVDFTVAAITLVVRDDFTLYALLERLVDVLDVFDVQREVVEVLVSVFDLSTLCADHLRALLATKDSLEKIFARSWFESVF